MATPSQILLASRSPRRQELVRALWPLAELRVLPPPSADEPGFDDCQTWTEIEARISQIAHLKAEAVRPLWQADPLWSGAWLIAADTTVVVGDEHAGWQVRGPPADGPQWRPEVTRWWDAYCPSNWGARADGVAASLGIETVRWWARPDRVDTRATWPGGVGALAEKLAAVVRERHQEGIVTAATVLSVTQSGDGVEVTYFHDGAVVGVRARAAIVAVPKYMARHLLPDLPADQREAMGRITYNPYCVVNVLCARPVRRHAFDTWFPGRRFTDCIAADWVSSARGGDDAGRLLTCYVPLADGEREALLDDDRCRELASAVVADLCAAWPGEKPEPVEVHLYRRGHAIHASAPGLTRHQALARRPLGRIAFAHGDVGSLVASSSGAIRAARRALEEVAALP
jgi:hypothetical protein